MAVTFGTIPALERAGMDYVYDGLTNVVIGIRDTRGVVRTFGGVTAATYAYGEVPAPERDDLKYILDATTGEILGVRDEVGVSRLFAFLPDTAAPVFVSAAVSGGTPSLILVTMSEVLGLPTPAPSAFTVPGKTVASVVLTGAVIRLTLSADILSTDAPTVTYTQPATGRLQDTAGNLVASFGPVTVANGVAPAPAPAPSPGAPAGQLYLDSDAIYMDGEPVSYT